MPSQHFPVHINPFQLAKSGVNLQGSMSFRGMERLLEVIANPKGEVSVELKFGFDDRNVCYVKGNIKTQVELVCQRCLQNFYYEINSQFLLSPVHNDEEMKALNKTYEPLLVTDEVLLKTMIEDEILLSLPIVPMHQPAECGVKLATTDDRKYKSSHPFAKLAELKRKKK